jgi:hypothetical protein
MIVRGGSTVARLWHAAVAVLVVAALVVQVIIAVQAASTPPSHGVGQVAGAALITRLIRIISFFTIESNILSAVVSAQLARNPYRDGPIWRVVRLATLFGITVTGIVYSTVLARVHEPHGWAETSTNTVFHYIVPIAMVLGWLAFGPRPRIRAAVVGWSLVWPFAYLGYTLVHGAVSKWYPYPFLDVTTHGYARVVLNSVVVTVVFGVVGALFALGDRWLPPAPRSRRPPRPLSWGGSGG